MTAGNWGAGPIWLLAGLALLALELLVPGVFLMWLGFAAIGTGLLTVTSSIGFDRQVMVYLVLAATLVVLALKLRRMSRLPSLNMPGSGLVGRSATALAFKGTEGRIRVGDSDWAAEVEAGCDPPLSGDMLQVAAVRGTVLVVRPHPDAPPPDVPPPGDISPPAQSSR